MKYKYYVLSAIIIFLLIFTVGCKSQEEKLHEDYLNAVNLIETGKYNQAKTILENCIKESPDNGKYFFMLGNLYRNQQDYDNALHQYISAVQKSPNIKESYNNIAGIYMLQGKYDNAIKIIDDGLENFPDFSELIFKKAQLIFFEKQYNETIELMNKVIDKPEYVEGYRFIGLSYLNLSDSAKALENLQIYLENTSDNSAGKKDIENIVNQLKN